MSKHQQSKEPSFISLIDILTGIEADLKKRLNPISGVAGKMLPFDLVSALNYLHDKVASLANLLNSLKQDQRGLKDKLQQIRERSERLQRFVTEAPIDTQMLLEAPVGDIREAIILATLSKDIQRCGSLPYFKNTKLSVDCNEAAFLAELENNPRKWFPYRDLFQKRPEMIGKPGEIDPLATLLKNITQQTTLIKKLLANVSGGKITAILEEIAAIDKNTNEAQLLNDLEQEVIYTIDDIGQIEGEQSHYVVSRSTVANEEHIFALRWRCGPPKLPHRTNIRCSPPWYRDKGVLRQRIEIEQRLHNAQLTFTTSETTMKDGRLKVIFEVVEEVPVEFKFTLDSDKHCLRLIVQNYKGGFTNKCRGNEFGRVEFDFKPTQVNEELVEALTQYIVRRDPILWYQLLSREPNHAKQESSIEIEVDKLVNRTVKSPPPQNQARHAVRRCTDTNRCTDTKLAKQEAVNPGLGNQSVNTLPSAKVKVTPADEEILNKLFRQQQGIKQVLKKTQTVLETHKTNTEKSLERIGQVVTRQGDAIVDIQEMTKKSNEQNYNLFRWVIALWSMMTFRHRDKTGL